MFPPPPPFPTDSPRSTRPNGFTMVELLVVLAIIAVLSALAFPALNKVRATADRAASMSNLKQWASALLLAMAENNQEIPYEGTSQQPSWEDTATDGNESAWFNRLPPYAGIEPLVELTTADQRASAIDRQSIFASPGADLSRSVNSGRPQFSYMINTLLYDSTGPSDSGSELIRAMQIASPSRTIFMSETRVSPRDGPPDTTTPASQLALANGGPSDVSYRFNGRSNIVFLDGHVESLPSDELEDDEPDDDLIWNPWVTE